MAHHRIRLAAAGLTLVAGGVVAGSLLVGGSFAATGSDDDSGPVGPGTGQGARPQPHEHVDVTGADLAAVTDAVEAHDASITVEHVRQDPDGSYDVLGTRDGEPVALDVSEDLTTFTERGGPGGGPCGPGGPGGAGGPGGPGENGDPGGPGGDTEVTGADLVAVTEAVVAHDGSITVEHVRQDPDGSYDVLGTRDGEPVFLEVSEDLATVTKRVFDGEHRPGGPHPFGPPDGAPDTAPTPGAGTPS